MKYLLVAVFVSASLVPRALSYKASFCKLPELSDSFSESRSVFLGQPIRIDEPKTDDGNAPIADRAFTVKFQVIRSWKGVPTAASDFSVLWLSNCYECLDLPNKNEKYLVFATPLSGSKAGSLVTMCNRTVGIRSDSNLANPSINPEQDMKKLDDMTKHAFTVAPTSNRRPRVSR